MIYEDVFNYSQPAGEPYMYVIMFWQSLLQTSLYANNWLCSHFDSTRIATFQDSIF